MLFGMSTAAQEGGCSRGQLSRWQLFKGQLFKGQLFKRADVPSFHLPRKMRLLAHQQLAALGRQSCRGVNSTVPVRHVPQRGHLLLQLQPQHAGQPSSLLLLLVVGGRDQRLARLSVFLLLLLAASGPRTNNRRQLVVAVGGFDLLVFAG